MPHRCPPALTTCAALVAVAWGVLSIGAVYGWGYGPLMAVAVVSGVAGLARGGGRTCSEAGLGAALVLLWAATAVQLVPIPAETVAWLSPATDRLLRQYDINYVVAVTPHPLSIHPRATWLGLAFLLSFSVLLLGLADALSESGSHRLVQSVVFLGLAVALIGIIQRAFSTDKIYGFWIPRVEGEPFGPFVNRNHFAGWMVMALCVGLGCFWARAAYAMRSIQPGWSNRLLWYASPDANNLVVTAFAIVVMALSLVLSMSRSGITSLTVSLVLATWCVTRRLTGTRRILAASYLGLVFLVAFGWGGVDAVQRRFEGASWASLGGRLDAWGDAFRIISDFRVFGTGLNTYGTATLFYSTSQIDRHFREAHNDYLQVLAEGGLLLAIPAALVVAAFLRILTRRLREDTDQSTYWIRVGAATGLVAIALQEVVEFSLQMPGNAALFCVLAAVVIHRGPAGMLPPLPAAERGCTHEPQSHT